MVGRPIKTLKALHAAEAACRRCPRYRNAAQAVPGVHPCCILRIKDEADKKAQYRGSVADLKICARTLAKPA